MALKALSNKCFSRYKVISTGDTELIPRFESRSQGWSNSRLTWLQWPPPHWWWAGCETCPASAAASAPLPNFCWVAWEYFSFQMTFPFPNRTYVIVKTMEEKFWNSTLFLAFLHAQQWSSQMPISELEARCNCTVCTMELKPTTHFSLNDVLKAGNRSAV